jgi:DHA2 family multidrug resistance protein-like MFS transporter
VRRRDVRGLFRERTFSASAVLLTVGILVMAGSQLFTLQYLQLVNVV